MSLTPRPLPGWLRRVSSCVEQDPPTPVCDGARFSSGHGRFSSGGDGGVLCFGDGPIQAGGARQTGWLLRCSHGPTIAPTTPTVKILRNPTLTPQLFEHILEA